MNNAIVCETVSSVVKGKKWTDDMGSTCEDLSNRSHHEVMQWCSDYGSQVNPDNALSADEACPNLCSVKMTERFIPRSANAVAYNIVGVGTFDAAKQLISSGCSMVSRKDVMENHAKLSLFASGLKHPLWVDAHRTSATEFKWSDGSNMVMGAAGHWAHGEPNNVSNAENRVLFGGENGEMNDINENANGVVVEACPMRIKSILFVGIGQTCASVGRPMMESAAECKAVATGIGKGEHFRELRNGWDMAGCFVDPNTNSFWYNSNKSSTKVSTGNRRGVCAQRSTDDPDLTEAHRVMICGESREISRIVAAPAADAGYNSSAFAFELHPVNELSDAACLTGDTVRGPVSFCSKRFANLKLMFDSWMPVLTEMALEDQVRVEPYSNITNFNDWHKSGDQGREKKAGHCRYWCEHGGNEDGRCKRSEYLVRENGTCSLFE